MAVNVRNMLAHVSDAHCVRVRYLLRKCHALSLNLFHEPREHPDGAAK